MGVRLALAAPPNRSLALAALTKRRLLREWRRIVACFIGVYFTVVYAGLIYGHALGLVYREARGLDSDFPEQVSASF